MTVSLLSVVFHKEEKLILSISRRSRNSHNLIFPPHESGRSVGGRGKSGLKQEEEQDHKSFTRERDTLPTSSEAATRKEEFKREICSETGGIAESEFLNQIMKKSIITDFPRYLAVNRKKISKRRKSVWK